MLSRISFRLKCPGFKIHTSSCAAQAHSLSSNKLTDKQKELMAKGLPKKKKLENVKNVLLVASGKGGVGKSTTAVNIAAALKSRLKSQEIGILDMDIFGPSLPIMMSLENHKPQLDKKGQMIPLINHAIHCMSIGFLVPGDSALVWRGPMVMSAIQKLILTTAWPELHTLVLDLPPGTGDVPLSIAQLVDITGAVLVTTPQDVALADVTRGAEMFGKVKVPCLGVIQNMSSYTCPSCGNVEHLFGKDGAEKIANKLGVPVLGDVPISLAIREGGDSGKPIVITSPDSTQLQIFLTLDERMKPYVEFLIPDPPAPKTVTKTERFKKYFVDVAIFRESHFYPPEHKESHIECATWSANRGAKMFLFAEGDCLYSKKIYVRKKLPPHVRKAVPVYMVMDEAFPVGHCIYKNEIVIQSGDNADDDAEDGSYIRAHCTHGYINIELIKAETTKVRSYYGYKYYSD